MKESVKSVYISESISLNNKLNVAIDYIPNSWNFYETFRIFNTDPFLQQIGVIVFIYYTSVWAIVSTLMLYLTHHLQFSTVSLGWVIFVVVVVIVICYCCS